MKIWAAISMLVYVAACSISTSLPLSTVERLDTRNIIGFRFADSILVNYTAEAIKAALPNETSLCYTGFIKDTIFYARESRYSTDTTEITRHLVIITGASEANIEEAGPNYLNYVDEVACGDEPDLIAVAHSHPTAGPFSSCTHSDADAIFTHKKQTRYVMSFVWCPYGIGILWADGRRWEKSAVPVLTNWR